MRSTADLASLAAADAACAYSESAKKSDTSVRVFCHFLAIDLLQIKLHLAGQRL